jgi:hypothetical protein
MDTQDEIMRYETPEVWKHCTVALISTLYVLGKEITKMLKNLNNSQGIFGIKGLPHL